MKKFIGITGGLFFLAFSFTACEEINNLEADAEERLADYFLVTEANALYLYALMDEGLRSAELASEDSVQVDGAWLKRSTNLGPNNYTLDFGKGVTGDEGTVREGQVVVSGSAAYLEPGSVHYLDFSNYRADEKTFAGRLSITYDGNDQFTVTAQDQIYNDEFRMDINQSVRWLAGLSTPNDFADDDISIEGTFSGVDFVNADSVDMIVVEPLRLFKGCEYGMVSGVVDATLDGENIKFESGSLDFIQEDGCLDLVKITFDDGTETATVTKSFKGF